MRPDESVPDPADELPGVLPYAKPQPTGSLLIERYADTVWVIATQSCRNYWWSISKALLLASFMLAIAVPTSDVRIIWGVRVERAGTLARVASGLVGTVSGAWAVLNLTRPRRSMTLRIKNGQMSYDGPIFGLKFLDLELIDIDSVVFTKVDQDEVASLRVLTKRGGDFPLFPGRDEQELERVADLLNRSRRAALPQTTA